MKKRISLAVLLLCLFALSACRAETVLDDVARQLRETNETEEPAAEAASDPDGEVQTEPQEQAASETDTGSDTAEEPEEEASETDAGVRIEIDVQSGLPEETPHPDFAAMSLSECVADAEGAAGLLPRITLDCEGARSINEDIEGTFRYLVGQNFCWLSYDSYKSGGVLSVVVIEKYENDVTFYTPYSLDLVTGMRLSGGELMEKAGVDAQTLTEAELSIMGEEFQHMYGVPGDGEEDAFLREQYERTVDPMNAETDRLWLDDSGRLFFVAKIYSMAGAELYEYPMLSGFSAW